MRLVLLLSPQVAPGLAPDFGLALPPFPDHLVLPVGQAFLPELPPQKDAHGTPARIDDRPIGSLPEGEER
jgi:hypothetical protein